MNVNQNNLTRIGVFYDGNYFAEVGKYYNYEHRRRARINIKGLHKFIEKEVANKERSDEKSCQIIEAHYFRGRFNASDTSDKQLRGDRAFDQILYTAGIVTHYSPLKKFDDKLKEKGVDVSLALEAFELATYKKFDVVALVVCDGDYVPLVRKLNTLGIRVMLLSWDIEGYKDNRPIKTSQELLSVANYYIAMHQLIDSRDSSDISEIFMQHSEAKGRNSKSPEPEEKMNILSEEKIGTIFGLHEGINGRFGFIKYPNNNLFFHWSNVVEGSFSDLKKEDKVKYKITKNDEEEDVAIDVKLVTATDVNPLTS